jgi:hypothetical protein
MKNTKTIASIISIIVFLLAVSTVRSEEKAEHATIIKDACNNSSDTFELRDFANDAERWFDTIVLVGQNIVHTEISVNRHSDSLNYGQFLAQLNINGFTAYKINEYIKIIGLRDIRSAPIPIVEQGKSYFDDEYVTDYIKTEKSCASTIIRATRPFVPQYGHLSDYNSHTLVIVDTYKNIQRLRLSIKAIESNMDASEDCPSNK